MAKQYSAEFKLEAVRRIERTKEPVARVAADLGVNENTMHRCLKQYRVAKLCKVLLNQEFTADRPNQKMVSDITYLWTDEGCLYISAVMDLFRQKIVGLSMSDRMTKELPINALRSAWLHSGRIHSDRGSQYCSNDYQALLKDFGFICSMSRKGNCWDNAPMETFWGKMKYEWLYGFRFRTRDEARAAVFEYVQIFYNRNRLHASNGYLTPEEYYNIGSKEAA